MMFDEEPDGDPHGECAAEITMLRTALRQVAQAHAWLAFGECRSFGSDVTLLSPSDADAVARVALGGVLTDKDKPYTAEAVGDMVENLKDAARPNGGK